MLIVMKAGHTPEQLGQVISGIEGLGFVPHVIPGERSVAVGITGNPGAVDPAHFLHLVWV